MDFSSRATAKDAEICCRRAYAFDSLAASLSFDAFFCGRHSFLRCPEVTPRLDFKSLPCVKGGAEGRGGGIVASNVQEDNPSVANAPAPFAQGSLS